jgi:hypothetical protein
MAKSFKDLKKELKEKDPAFYDEIMTEASREIEEIRKTWGGKRFNAGRPVIYSGRKKTTFELEEADIINLRDYAKKHKISQNRAIHKAISLLSRKEA